MELDDRLTTLLLERFDRRPDELAEFDLGLVQHTKARLLDGEFVVNNPAVLRGDDEVKAVLKERPKVLCGDFLIMGKWIEPKGRPKYWKTNIEQITPQKGLPA